MDTAYSVGFAEVRWQILPLETPRVWRHCSKCGAVRRFSSSDKFRLNANQRKVDVWLIYRCTECESTWNCTIFTRCTPEAIGGALYQRLQQNDPETARQYAFDLALLHRLGVRVDAAVPVRVERTLQHETTLHESGQKIFLAVPYLCEVRLDRLLASELGVTRSCLQRWVDTGFLHVWPEDKTALRKSIRNGQIILLSLKPGEQEKSQSQPDVCSSEP